MKKYIYSQGNRSSYNNISEGRSWSIKLIIFLFDTSHCKNLIIKYKWFSKVKRSPINKVNKFLRNQIEIKKLLVVVINKLAPGSKNLLNLH